MRVHTDSPKSGKESSATAWVGEVERIYHQCGVRVYSLARRMLGNDNDAEDVAQEVLLQLVRDYGDSAGEATVTIPLYRVTVDAVLAIRRKRSIHRELQFAEAWVGSEDNYHSRGDRSSSAVDAKVLHGELCDRIEFAIAQLPDDCRDSFVLGDIEKLTYAEIGGILNLCVVAVKSRIHRARLILCNVLQPYLN